MWSGKIRERKSNDHIGHEDSDEDDRRWRTISMLKIHIHTVNKRWKENRVGYSEQLRIYG